MPHPKAISIDRTQVAKLCERRGYSEWTEHVYHLGCIMGCPVNVSTTKRLQVMTKADFYELAQRQGLPAPEWPRKTKGLLDESSILDYLIKYLVEFSKRRCRLAPADVIRAIYLDWELRSERENLKRIQSIEKRVRSIAQTKKATLVTKLVSFYDQELEARLAYRKLPRGARQPLYFSATVEEAVELFDA